MATRNVSFYGNSPLIGKNSAIQRDYAADPRRQMAEQLMAQGSSTAPVRSPLEGMTRALQAGVGGYFGGQADRETKEREDKQSMQIVDALAAGQPQIMPAWYEEMKAKGEDDDLLSAPAFVAENPNLYSEKDPYNPGGMPAVISSLKDTGNSDQNALIAQLQMGEFTRQQAVREDAKLRAQEIKDRDEQRAYDLKNPVLKPGVNVPFPKDVQSQKESLLRVKAGEKQKRLEEKEKAKEEARKNKPMPASAIKQQSALLEKIGLAQGINADMASISGLLEENKIELGLFDNWLSAGKNYVGMSDAESRNYATFNSTLEKMRNDSLRLNNGVQTEGDAQRAWNELFTNINDQDYVKQRLKEIIVINKRAENLQRYQVDVLRNEFDKPALESMPSVRGAPGNTLTDPLSEEDQEAVDWARANPNDPRSAQILKLHGG